MLLITCRLHAEQHIMNTFFIGNLIKKNSGSKHQIRKMCFYSCFLILKYINNEKLWNFCSSTYHIDDFSFYKSNTWTPFLNFCFYFIPGSNLKWVTVVISYQLTVLLHSHHLTLISLNDTRLINYSILTSSCVLMLGHSGFNERVIYKT